MYFSQLHVEIQVWCLFDVCLLGVFHQLKSFVKREEMGGPRGRSVCFLSNLNMFACHRAHCLLTVTHCSSVEEQLSWLDSNGKHMVRLVTNKKMNYME